MKYTLYLPSAYSVSSSQRARHFHSVSWKFVPQGLLAALKFVLQGFTRLNINATPFKSHSQPVVAKASTASKASSVRQAVAQTAAQTPSSAQDQRSVKKPAHDMQRFHDRARLMRQIYM